MLADAAVAQPSDLAALIRVDVAYADGDTLAYLFPRATRIVDLNAMIGRAGRVRKVILCEEIRSGVQTPHKAVN